MDDKKLLAKIKYAQEYAKKYFHADQATATMLLDANMELIPPSFFVEFPDVDTMRCTPSLLGTPAGLWFYYRLRFNAGGSMTWLGQHPIYPWIDLKSIEVPSERSAETNDFVTATLT
jgi:hypothetical protein